MEDLHGSTIRKRSPVSESSCDIDSRNSTDHRQETTCKFTKWTDEKHSLYLKSMETSFVNQLYDSLDIFGWRPEQKSASEYAKSGPNHTGIRTPSGQFKVFQDGSWTRINFMRERSRPKQVYESGNILSNPWIEHYRLPNGSTSTISITKQEGVSSTGSVYKSSSSCLQMDLQNTVESNAEVTDQNFVDEASEEEKLGRKQHMKCRKISAGDDLQQDQVHFISSFT